MVQFVVGNMVAIEVGGERTNVAPAAIDLVIPRCPEHPGIEPRCAQCQRLHSARRRAARVRSQPGVTVPTELLGALLRGAGPRVMARAREKLGIGTIVGIERKMRE